MYAYEVVCELQSYKIGIGILEVDDYELLVRVLRKHEGRISIRDNTQNIAILGLVMLADVYLSVYS